MNNRMLCRNLFFAVVALSSLAGCAQTIDVRASHFAVPIVPDRSFSGHATLAAVSKTRVRLLENYHSTPPVDGATKINEDASVSDVFFPISNLSLDLRLALAGGAELYSHGSAFGLRWQILNHGAGPDKWVAAIHGASGTFRTTLSTGSPPTAEASSQVKTGQGGVSVGYRFHDVTPYVSYIYEHHDASSDVKNTGGTYGPYEDSGYHQYATFGVTSSGTGFSYGVEISSISMVWNGSTTAQQTATGIRLGWAW